MTTSCRISNALTSLMISWTIALPVRKFPDTTWIFKQIFRSASSFSVGRSPTCKLYKTQSTSIPISAICRGTQRALSTKRTKHVHAELIPIPCGPLRYELLFHSPFLEDAAFLSQRACFNFYKRYYRKGSRLDS